MKDLQAREEIIPQRYSLNQKLDLFNHVEGLAIKHEVTVSSTMIKVTYNKGIGQSPAFKNGYDNASPHVAINNTHASDRFCCRCKNEVNNVIKNEELNSESSSVLTLAKTSEVFKRNCSNNKVNLKIKSVSPRKQNCDSTSLSGVQNNKNEKLLKKRSRLRENEAKDNTKRKKHVNNGKVNKPEVTSNNKNAYDEILLKSSFIYLQDICDPKTKLSADNKIVNAYLNNERSKQIENADSQKDENDQNNSTQKIMYSEYLNSNGPQRRKPRKTLIPPQGVSRKKRTLDSMETEISKKIKLDEKRSRKEILLDDPNLPPGWKRIIRARVPSSPEYKTVHIISPSGRRFRYKAQLKRYLDETKSPNKIEEFYFGLYDKSNRNSSSAEENKDDSIDGFEEDIEVSIPEINERSTRVMNKKSVVERTEELTPVKDEETITKRTEKSTPVKSKKFTTKRTERLTPVKSEESTPEKSDDMKENSLTDVSLKEEGFSSSSDGSPDKRKVMMTDPSLPPGWTRTIIVRKRSNNSERAEACLISPEGRKFLRKYRLLRYLEKTGSPYSIDEFYFGRYEKTVSKAEQRSRSAEEKERKDPEKLNKTPTKEKNRLSKMKENKGNEMNLESINKKDFLKQLKLKEKTEEKNVAAKKLARKRANAKVLAAKNKKLKVLTKVNQSKRTRKSLLSDHKRPASSPEKSTKTGATGEKAPLERQPLLHDPNLPEGWTRILNVRTTGHRPGKKEVLIRGPDGKKHKSKSSVMEYLEKHNLGLKISQFDFSLYGTNKQEQQNKETAKKKKIGSSKSSNVPAGWKRVFHVSTVGTKAGQKQVVIVGPNGKRYKSRGCLNRYLKEQKLKLTIDQFDFTVPRKSEENQHSAVKIIQRTRPGILSADKSNTKYLLANAALLERQPLLHDPNLPEGWTRILNVRTTGHRPGKKEVLIRGPDGKKHKSKSSVMEYLEKHNLGLKISQFDFSLYGTNKQKQQNKETAKKEKVVSSKSNPVPSGWKRVFHVPTVGTKAGKKQVVIVGPNGKRYKSRGCLKRYLKEQKLKLTIDQFDFTVHRKSDENQRSAVKIKQRTRPGILSVDKSNTKYLLTNAVRGLLITCGLTTAEAERKPKVPIVKKNKKPDKVDVVNKINENSQVEKVTQIEAVSKEDQDAVKNVTKWVHKLAKSKSNFGSLRPEAASAIASATKSFVQNLAVRSLSSSAKTENSLRYEHIADLVDTSSCLSPLRTLVPKKMTYKDFIRLNSQNSILSFT